MGPAPMIRMVEISVLLGIKSHGRELGTKKGRACCASLEPLAPGYPRARVVFSPDSATAKGPWRPINRQFAVLETVARRRSSRLRSSSYGAASPSSRLACRAEAAPPRLGGASSEGWRPGLDLNQDKERCTAPASTLPPPGRADHRRSRRGEPPLAGINVNQSPVCISD